MCQWGHNALVCSVRLNGVSQMADAVGYIRVSTEDQATQGVSLDAQAERIRAYATLNDLNLRNIYVDAGISGRRADNRPELQNALNDVCRGGGVLVVYSLSRLARSTKDTIDIADRLQKHGADLASISEKIDTTSASGRMVYRLLAVLAQWESEQLGERVKGAMAHKKACNGRVGAVPFGYDLADDGDTLIPNPEEQEIIALMRSLRSAGKSYREIASELTSRGVKPKNGKPVWVHTSVVSILKNAA